MLAYWREAVLAGIPKARRRSIATMRGTRKAEQTTNMGLRKFLTRCNLTKIWKTMTNTKRKKGFRAPISMKCTTVVSRKYLKRVETY